jgi:hypothetical protein
MARPYWPRIGGERRGRRPHDRNHPVNPGRTQLPAYGRGRVTQHQLTTARPPVQVYGDECPHPGGGEYRDLGQVHTQRRRLGRLPPQHGPELVHVGDVDLPRHAYVDRLVGHPDLKAPFFSALPHTPDRRHHPRAARPATGLTSTTPTVDSG